jgi:hypothetical protein
MNIFSPRMRAILVPFVPEGRTVYELKSSDRVQNLQRLERDPFSRKEFLPAQQQEK